MTRKKTNGWSSPQFIAAKPVTKSKLNSRIVQVFPFACCIWSVSHCNGSSYAHIHSGEGIITENSIPILIVKEYNIILLTLVMAKQDSIIKQINDNPMAGWEAAMNPRFSNYTVSLQLEGSSLLSSLKDFPALLLPYKCINRFFILLLGPKISFSLHRLASLCNFWELNQHPKRICRVFLF